MYSPSPTNRYGHGHPLYAPCTITHQAARPPRCQVIRTKGYATTVIDEICQAAGVTKGSFFHTIKGKEDLAISPLRWSDVAGPPSPRPTTTACPTRATADRAQYLDRRGRDAGR